MKRKLDFVIAEDDMNRKIFRFYPYRSHCHGFYDAPPKKWEEVYKVYYAYAILLQWKDNEGNIEPESTDVLFDVRCDEGSQIGTTGYICEHLEECKNELNKEIYPCGDGISWKIEKFEGVSVNIYSINLWDINGVGCKFNLYEKEMNPFGEYLSSCCEYMLKHSEGI